MTRKNANTDTNDSIKPQQRLDKWLWAARFFKTRSLANAAVTGGKVHVNGERCKPSRHLHPGDHLLIQRGGEPMDVEVVGFNEQRRPATEACLLYQETSASRARREAESTQRQLLRADKAQERRPDKRERRQIRRFIRQEEAN